ncbi:MAG: TRAP transporter substrate-binding protein [Faecalibacterium sp.]|nr:TRAP transporter substrate-binding protein [Faecalibacterium sp.]
MKKISRRSFLMAAGAVAATGVLAACGGSSSSAPAASGGGTVEEKPVTIKWASSVSEAEIKGNNTPMSIAINTWKETCEKESGGSITIEIYPGSTLASGTEATLSGLLTGSFEMSQLNTGSWGDYTDAFAALNVPYLYTDFSLVHAVMDSEFGDGMKQQVLDEVNVIPLCYADIGYRHVTNSKGEIKSPADMKGLKIRTMTDAVQIASFEDLGCSVTPMSISELFSALQTKMVDAQENPLTTINSQKYYEVQQYCTLTRHSYTTTLFFMNVDFYNSLSDKQKAAVEAANKAATEQSRARLAEAEKEAQATLEAAGMKFYELSDAEMAAFQDAVAPTWETIKKSMGDDKWNELMATVDAAK